MRYLKNILNHRFQDFSNRLIKELKTKLEYLPLHLSLVSFSLKKRNHNLANSPKNGAYETRIKMDLQK